MSTPGASVGSGAGVVQPPSEEEGIHGAKFQLEGQDVKIPKPEDIQELLTERVSLGDLRSRLESKYPGYTLPDKTYLQRILGKKNENLGKLRQRLGFQGSYFSFLYCNEEGAVVRSERYDEAGSDIAMDSSDRDMTTLQASDNIFLVKKTEGAPGSNR